MRDQKVSEELSPERKHGSIIRQIKSNKCCYYGMFTSLEIHPNYSSVQQ